METFEEFKKSFSYGDRNNNNFKFLADMSDNDAADFIEKLIHEAGAALDHGRVDNIIDLIIQGQKQTYSKPAKYTYQEGPFQKFDKSPRIIL